MMKKTFLLVAIAIMGFSATSSAQEYWNFGVKGGVNFTNMTSDGFEDNNVDSDFDQNTIYEALTDYVFDRRQFIPVESGDYGIFPHFTLGNEVAKIGELEAQFGLTTNTKEAMAAMTFADGSPVEKLKYISNISPLASIFNPAFMNLFIWSAASLPISPEIVN